MKKTVTQFAALIIAVMTFGTAFADNFSYCYSKERGLDEECLARKNNETSYQQQQQYDREHGSSSSDSNSSYSSGSYSNNSGGRFEPIPIPQRQIYVLPGMQ